MIRTACWMVAFIALLLAAPWASARAEEPTVDFRRIAEMKLRETLTAVRNYIDTNPNAPDRPAAMEWLLTSGMQYGLEDETVETARQVLEIPGLNAEAERLARVNLFMGLAKKGETEPALVHFEAFLKGLRLQQAAAGLEYTHAFSAKCRVQGDFATAKQAYESTRSTFPLIGQVTETANLRLGRIEMIGQDPPALPKGSLGGDSVDLAAWKGKVVLVDFWATNCPPCLAEIPNLKDLYQRHHEKGLEIIGVSFDEHPETATAFARRAEMKWPMVMNKSELTPVGEAWRVSLIPSIFLIGRDGKIANVDLYGADLRKTIEKLMAEEAK